MACERGINDAPTATNINTKLELAGHLGRYRMTSEQLIHQSYSATKMGNARVLPFVVGWR